MKHSKFRKLSWAEVKNREMPLHFTLLCYFLLFGLLILVVLWIFQSFFLESFYTSTKKNAAEKSAKIIAESLENNQNPLATIENVASYNSLCVQVYDTSTAFFQKRYECNYASPSVSLNIEAHKVYSYYSCASDNNGSCLEIIGENERQDGLFEDYEKNTATNDTASKLILKQISESYRKIRNTARYILGNVYDFNPDTDSVPVNELMPMDKWAIVKLNELIAKVKQAYDNYEFHQVYHSIRNFCVIDMSNFYLDVLKDRLYTEKSDSKSRKAAQTAIYIILNAMTRMISPILAYTSDEIWKYMPHSSNENAENVIFNEMPNQVEIETDADFMSFWDEIHQLRDDVKKSLEGLIKDKTIKSSLEAKVTLKASGEKLEFLKKAEPELAAAFIVSAVEIAENDGELEIAVDKAIGEKCERCWIISETVGTDSEHPHLCKRCCNILK